MMMSKMSITMSIWRTNFSNCIAIKKKQEQIIWKNEKTPVQKLSFLHKIGKKKVCSFANFFCVTYYFYVSPQRECKKSSDCVLIFCKIGLCAKSPKNEWCLLFCTSSIVIFCFFNNKKRWLLPSFCNQSVFLIWCILFWFFCVFSITLIVYFISSCDSCFVLVDSFSSVSFSFLLLPFLPLLFFFSSFFFSIIFSSPT